MKFAVYYNATRIVDEMTEKGELDSYPTGDDKFKGVYVCMDTNDFWICRITEGCNEDYEKEGSKFLIERNKISIYDVMDKLHDKFKKRLPVFTEKDLSYEKKNKVHSYLDKFTTKDIVRAVISLDNDDCLGNWDYWVKDSLEAAIDTIDAGFGILAV